MNGTLIPTKIEYPYLFSTYIYIRTDLGYEGQVLAVILSYTNNSIPLNKCNPYIQWAIPVLPAIKQTKRI